MRTFFQFALLGLGPAAIYVLMGQGMVLIYRGSGILNLAHGAFAMVGAYLFYEMHVLHGHNAALALIVTVAAVALLGALTDQLLLRRLRQGSGLARLIGTLAVLLVLQAIAVLRYGEIGTYVRPILPSEPVTILGATVASDRLWLITIAAAFTIVLTLASRHSRMGWVMSAVSENQRASAALGWSPQVVSASTWAIGAGFAGLSGVLIASITQLSATNLSLVVIPAMVAALLGGFVSFPLTFVGALAVGIAEVQIGRISSVPGARSAIPLVIVVTVLLAKGSALPVRGYITDRPPIVGSGRIRPVVAVPAVVLAALLIAFVLNDDWRSAVIVSFSVGVILLSLVVVAGFAGQLSLAQYALAGVGALIAARLVQSLDWPFPIALVCGVLGTALAALILALPTLRTRGVELAVVTMALGVTVQEMLFHNVDITGGVVGTDVGSPSLFGLNIDAFYHPERYALFSLAMFVVSAIAVANLRRGRSGRRMIAVRTNERAAAALGVDVRATKFQAFALAGALAGLGGILLSFRASTVVYGEGFGPLASISAVAWAVLGGLGFVMGGFVGGTFAAASVGELILESIIGSGSTHLALIGGIGLILVLLSDPNGSVHSVLHTWRPVLKRLFKDEPLPLAAPTAHARVTPRTLVVSNLTVRYGGVVAVDSLSFSVGPGEIVGLIGPNGAGKTSVIDAVSGFAACSGDVQLSGEDVRPWTPSRRARRGLVRSFQSLELFEDLTVLENLQTASESSERRSLVRDLVNPGQATLSPTSILAVSEFGLQGLLNRRPSELSYGQRRLVAIARAVSMQPSVLLLDEPVAGLDANESREFGALVRRLALDWGIAVLVIEHDMDFVMRICDRLVVINFGAMLCTGSPDEVRQDPAAIAAYLGQADEHATV